MKFEAIDLGDELSLTSYNFEDASDLAEEINDPEIYANTLTIPYPYSIEDAQEFLTQLKSLEEESGKHQNFAIRLHGKVIGGVGLLYNYGYDSNVSEIGYWVSKRYRRKGFMTRAIRALIQYSFEKAGLVRLEAQVFPANEASSKVLIKNNFTLKEKKRKSMLKDGKFLDTWLYILNKEDGK